MQHDIIRLPHMLDARKDALQFALGRERTRSHLKNASDSRWRRCTPLKNAHNLKRLLSFLIGVRLALGCDLLFLRWLLVCCTASNRSPTSLQGGGYA
jgi:hypothetical protein